MSTIHVTKRNGTREPFNADKINRLLEWATEGLNAEPSNVAIRAEISMFDGVSTDSIHQVLIEAAVAMIDVANPDYQYVAARLLLAQLRKQVWGESVPPSLEYIIRQNADSGVYADWTTEAYSPDEIAELGEYIDHAHDYKFTHAGLCQMMAKYLIIDRTTGYIYETPQTAYMLIAMGLCMNKDKGSRLSWVKSMYDDFVYHRINLPTPTMAGVRSRVKSYASCALVEIGDSLDSIMSNLTACATAVSNRYGLGLDMSSIRAIGAPIRGGESVHSGVIPILKMYAAVIRGLYQGGVRQGSATVHFNWWHYEIDSIIMLRCITGAEEARVRALDYSINFDELFLERAKAGKTVTLFSPEQVPELLDAFGTPKFRALYEQAESNPDLRCKVVPARTILEAFLLQRYETSRMYAFFADSVNRHTPWLDQVRTSNLCQEILFPLVPATSLTDPNAELGVCVLSAVNLLECFPNEGVFDDTIISGVCRNIVHALDGLIDVQNYFHPGAKKFAQSRRALGVGVTNLAAVFAREGLTYDSPEAPNLAARIMEMVEYWLLRASCDMARDFGPCDQFSHTKWSQGVFPIDTYAKAIDTFVTEPLHMDWEALRIDVAIHGLRHSTLTAIMPAESSSVIQNSTNGIEPPKTLVISKKSGSGMIRQLVPGAGKWEYQMAYDTTNAGRLRVAAALQKFTDMAISLNTYYNPKRHPGGRVPMKVLLDDFYTAAKHGLHTLYYSFSNDADHHSVAADHRPAAEPEELGCAGGACAI